LSKVKNQPDLEEQLRRLKEVILVASYWQERGYTHPSETYKPHELGQLQFHRSTHIIRCLFPGNGFGKTRCIAEEAHAWCTHTNRWQKTPDWPVQVLWIARGKKQFKLIRDQIEVETIGTSAKFRGSDSDGEYIYPGGDTITIGLASKSGDWHKYEGINPDLVVFDEMPRQDLWREMMMRRRVRKKTRFAVAATATTAGSWAEEEIYTDWLLHHEQQGLAEWIEDSHPKRTKEGAWLYPLEVEPDAHGVNNHKTTWVWTKGGIYSNPGADASDFEWYEGRKWSSQKEREVRLFGGFNNWLGDSVFDEGGLSYLLDRARELRRITTGVRSGRVVGYRSLG
jgi:hypothetical protein